MDGKYWTIVYLFGIVVCLIILRIIYNVCFRSCLNSDCGWKNRGDKMVNVNVIRLKEERSYAVNIGGAIPSEDSSKNETTNPITVTSPVLGMAVDIEAPVIDIQETTPQPISRHKSFKEKPRAFTRVQQKSNVDKSKIYSVRSTADSWYVREFMEDQRRKRSNTMPDNPTNDQEAEDIPTEKPEPAPKRKKERSQSYGSYGDCIRTSKNEWWYAEYLKEKGIDVV